VVQAQQFVAPFGEKPAPLVMFVLRWHADGPLLAGLEEAISSAGDGRSLQVAARVARLGELAPPPKKKRGRGGQKRVGAVKRKGGVFLIPKKKGILFPSRFFFIFPQRSGTRSTPSRRQLGAPHTDPGDQECCCLATYIDRQPISTGGAVGRVC